MSSNNKEKIVRFYVAGIPIIKAFINKLNIDLLLSKYVPHNGNESISITDSLKLIIYNITIGRDPLYELKEWILKISLYAHGVDFDDPSVINDDRFARALDKLYFADRASLMTSLVIDMIKAFKIDTSQIHNDSTTIKAYGKIPGITNNGLTLAYGKSKDHRPDLKQILYCLTISADGGVPVHYKTYPGNRTDDTTHIETWNILRKIIKHTDFLYVADCKVCTHQQLSEIVKQGGQVVSIVPETWKEVKDFKEIQKTIPAQKKLIWQRPIPNNSKEFEEFYAFKGEYFTYKQKYRIYWIFSTEKQKNDSIRREKFLAIADKKLEELLPKINKYHLKTKKDILSKIAGIISHYRVNDLITISLKEEKQIIRKKIGKGRPSANAQYKEVVIKTYILHWNQNAGAIRREKRIDGIFPIISTNTKISAEKALKAYKYQPHLEKRFTQFKGIHEAAPILFKKIKRVESIMFLFFISLMIQSLIERVIRNKMKEKRLKALRIYPEFRKSTHPTTAQILRLFEDISYYQLKKSGKKIKEFFDELSDVQKQILQLLDISEKEYWN